MNNNFSDFDEEILQEEIDIAKKCVLEVRNLDLREEDIL